MDIEVTRDVGATVVMTKQFDGSLLVRPTTIMISKGFTATIPLGHVVTVPSEYEAKAKLSSSLYLNSKVKDCSLVIHTDECDECCELSGSVKITAKSDMVLNSRDVLAVIEFTRKPLQE